MKNIITTLAIAILFITGCKKDSQNSNILKIEVTEVTGTYSITINNAKSGDQVFAVERKSQNAIYEANVTPGDELDVYTSHAGGNRISFIHKSKPVGGSSSGNDGKGSSKTTVYIPN